MSIVYAWEIIGLIFFIGIAADHLRDQWDFSRGIDWLDAAFCLAVIVVLWPMILISGYRNKDSRFWLESHEIIQAEVNP